MESSMTESGGFRESYEQTARRSRPENTTPSFRCFLLLKTLKQKETTETKEEKMLLDLTSLPPVVV